MASRIVSIFVFALFLLSVVSVREANSFSKLCEIRGTCFACDSQTGRYSFSQCSTDSECFPEEFCTVLGFCCPVPEVPPLQQTPPPSYFQQTVFAEEGDTEVEKCPDNSTWTRKCVSDHDCVFREEICAEGKCCPSCRKRRSLALDEQRRRDPADDGDLLILAADDAVDASLPLLIVPQCTEDGRFHRPIQCSATNECFCVTDFGARILPSSSIVVNGTVGQAGMNCTMEKQHQIQPPKLEENATETTTKIDVNLEKEKEELQSATIVATTTSVNVLPEKDEKEDYLEDVSREYRRSPTTTISRDQPVLSVAGLSMIDLVNADEDTVSGDQQQQQCSDRFREFRRCGSLCPISCATQLTPPSNNCPTGHQQQQDSCLKGCFCRLPYVLLDGTRPFSSKCVLPAECPLLAYDSGSLNTLTWEPQSWWDSKRVVPYSMFGGEIMNGQQQGEQQPTITTSSYFLREPPPKRCSDPLKNFQTCGSACPVSCGSKNDFVDCPTNCVPGCFCRVPYVLKNANDLNSECVLPHQCPPPQLDYTFVRLADDRCGGTEGNKTWSKCVSRKCSSTCEQTPSFCFPNDCRPGCGCSPGYVVLLDRSVPTLPNWDVDDDWQCILQEDCPPPSKQRRVNDEESSASWNQRFGRRRPPTVPATTGSLEALIDSMTAASSTTTTTQEPTPSPSSTTTSTTTTTTTAPVSPTTTSITKTSTTVAAPPFTTTSFLQQQQQEHVTAVLRHPFAQSSTNCEDDSTKEFLTCASSCPLGCDQLEARQCSPCISGCFCKNGFVFANATDWRRSDCVPISTCHEQEQLQGEILNGEDDENTRENQSSKKSSSIPKNDEKVEYEDRILAEPTTTTESLRIPDASRNCDEAIASAILFAGNGTRLGRLLAWPSRDGGEVEGLVRLIGLLAIQLPRDHQNPPLSLFLSIHKFGDTTIGGCRSLGPKLPITFRSGKTASSPIGESSKKQQQEQSSSMIFESPKKYQQKEEEGELLGRTMIASTSSSSSKEETKTNGPIARGSNPVIGHSVVLESRRNGQNWDATGVVACAVFGIVPSC